MRKSKLGALLLIGLSLAMLSSCGKINKEDDIDAVKKYCENFASKYEILDKGENGNVMMSINAPDFKSIMEFIIEEKKGQNITADDIEKAVEEHPECKKEYIFWSDGEGNNEIIKDFLEIVSEELIVEAIKNVEYTEEWSVE